MSDLRTAAQQALEALGKWSIGYHVDAVELNDLIATLETALEQPVQEAHWLTKKLMADYLDMIAEAISENSTEMLRHKAHWMRRGQV
jgi:hypothetical protein